MEVTKVALSVVRTLKVKVLPELVGLVIPAPRPKVRGPGLAGGTCTSGYAARRSRPPTRTDLNEPLRDASDEAKEGGSLETARQAATDSLSVTDPSDRCYTDVTDQKYDCYNDSGVRSRRPAAGRRPAW